MEVSMKLTALAAALALTLSGGFLAGCDQQGGGKASGGGTSASGSSSPSGAGGTSGGAGSPDAQKKSPGGTPGSGK
jgi:hypothetical protein